MPVKTFHNRYLFIKVSNRDGNIFQEIINAYISLYGYIGLAHARLRLIKEIVPGVFIIRVDGSAVARLITAIKFLSLKRNIRDINILGFSRTLKEGINKYIKNNVDKL